MLRRSFLIIILCVIKSNIVSSQDVTDGFFVCQDSGRPIPMDYVCDGYEDCSDGADENDCGSSFRCESYEFQCTEVEMCINMVFMCDGYKHCPDGSDERDCGLRDCKEWEYTCGNGVCIPELYRCDGYNDCGDNSDEDSCNIETCNPETEWACESNENECVAKNWRCDYEKDCEDGSDEKGCVIFTHRCGAGLFNCSQTNCISSRKLCDGTSDCEDNSDEDLSICAFGLDCEEFACPEKCLDTKAVCDGDYDCMDGSDEFGCPLSTCRDDQFKCIDGTCIGIDKRCNGIEDCSDSSDEFMCSLPSFLNCSGADEYRCEDGLQCVPSSVLCDGVEQCGDGSDEMICSSLNVTADGSNGCLEDNGECMQKCNYNGRLHYCSCDQGYVIDTTNKVSCLDVNECDVEYAACDQICINTDGGYSCACAEGYTESTEHGRCKATGPAINLLFTNWYDIQQLNVRTGQLNITIQDLTSATAIDYHYKYGLVFWSDINMHVIMKAKFDGTDRKIVADLGIRRPEGVAIDWLNDRIYWTDSELNRIEVANIDGTKRAVLFSGLTYPRDIVIDPIRRTLFWTEKSKIVRASLDGSYKKDFLMGISNYVSWPTGLTIDLPSQMLYWVDSGSRSISSCRTDGKHLRLLNTGNITHPFGITAFEDTLYWTDRNLEGIFSINRITGKRFRKVLTEVYKPLDLVGIHPALQPLYHQDEGLADPCAIDNGNCDYLCLSGIHNYTCYCPSFRNLLPNRHSCSRMDLFMLFSMSDRIHVLSLESSNRYDVKLPLISDTEMSNIAVIDWDSKHDLIFWGDTSLKTINSASINGSAQQVIVDTDVVNPSGIAVDWIGDKLYWADATLGRIYVSELNGSCVSAILTVDGEQLTDLVVDPLKGLLYYGVIVNDKKSYIMSAHLDGSNSRRVATFDDSVPVLMTIDYETQRLYWIDNINHQLLSIFINGSDYEELLDDGILYDSTGLTNHEGYLYWTDEIDGSIYQIEKEPPYETEKLISNRQNLRDISIFHRNRETPATHPCWSNNGGCSHLCFGVPSSIESEHEGRSEAVIVASCGCPTGFMLMDNERTCVSKVDQFLLFGTDSRIGTISLDINEDVDVTTPIHPKPTGVISMDYDLKNDHIYWIEEDSPAIYRAPINGGEREVVIQHGLVRPTALAIDWLGGNMYFGDSGTKRLEVCRLDGSSRKVLVSDNNVGEVLSIVVDLYSEYIFWSSSSPSPQVFRSTMDGSNPMAIIHSSEITHPVSMVIDNRGASSKLYVADSVQKLIKIFDTNGNGQERYTLMNSDITGLAVDEDYVYWMDGVLGILYRSLKENSNVRERVNTNVKGTSDLKLIRRTHVLENPSLSRNYACKEEGLCSHLCLPNWDLARYSCACPTGIQDQNNCPSVPSIYLLFATSNSIRRLSLETTEYHDVLLVHSLQKVSYIDYHLTSSNEGRIYWSDHINQSIMVSEINGSNTRPFLRLKRNLRGLSVDWTTGNVYYIDAGVPSIEMVDSTGTFVKVILNGSTLHDPVDLAVFPLEGYIFWTEWSQNPQPVLMRARMDGSDVRPVVKLDNQKPTHLTITPDTGHLYWVDADNGTIQTIKYDGTGHETVWRNMGQPFGVAAYGSSIFWSDVLDKMVYRCNSHNQLSQKRIQYIDREGGTPKGMVMVTADRKGEIDGNFSGSACGYKNGGCEYLCAPVSHEERKCLCPLSQPDCIEYVGIHSWTLPPSQPTSTNTIDTTTTYSVSSTTTVWDVSYTQSQSPTSVAQLIPQKIGDVMDNVSITVLVLTGIFLFAIVCVFFILLLLFWKFKRLPPGDDGLQSKAPFKSPMVHNPLYAKTSVSGEDEKEDKKNASVATVTKATAALKNLKCNEYQLNNTINFQQSMNAGKPAPARNLLPSPQELDFKPKPKVMNTTLEEAPCSLQEEPQEYQITPVQSRRHNSTSKSSSSPPMSPTVDAPVIVHYPVSSPAHKPNLSQLQQPPPKSAIINPSVPSPAKSARHVQFAPSIMEPPPLPPRGGRLSSCSSAFDQSPPIVPPPLSAPATSPPPSFSFTDLPISTKPAMFAARNPVFRMTSSSSESDVSGIAGSKELQPYGAGFSSDTDLVFQQSQ